jgi:hypothetical protein
MKKTSVIYLLTLLSLSACQHNPETLLPSEKGQPSPTVSTSPVPALPSTSPTPTSSTAPPVQPSLTPPASVTPSPAFPEATPQGFFSNQKVYETEAEQIYSTVKLQGKNGVISWFSDEQVFSPVGYVIRDLQMAEPLTLKDFPDINRIFPVFNEKGDGFILWHALNSDSDSNSYSVSTKAITDFQPQASREEFTGLIVQGDINNEGNGSLYKKVYDPFLPPSDAGVFSLWRYPIKKGVLDSKEVKIGNLPGRSFQVVLNNSGNGFVFAYKSLYAAATDVPYHLYFLTVSDFKITDEIYMLPDSYTDFDLQVENGEGALFIQDKIIPIQNYHPKPDLIRTVKIPAKIEYSQSDSRNGSWNYMNAQGNGLQLITTNNQNLSLRKIVNFQPIEPAHPIRTISDSKSEGLARYFSSANIEIDAQGNGLLSWQESEAFREIEPVTGNINDRVKSNAIYTRAIRDFKSWD